MTINCLSFSIVMAGENVPQKQKHCFHFLFNLTLVEFTPQSTPPVTRKWTNPRVKGKVFLSPLLIGLNKAHPVFSKLL